MSSSVQADPENSETTSVSFPTGKKTDWFSPKNIQGRNVITWCIVPTPLPFRWSFVSFSQEDLKEKIEVTGRRRV